jgi:hypothetical protein
MNHHFNPLEYSRELVKAGLPEAQADVHANTLAHVLEECVAQPAQLETLRQEFSFEFRSEISQVRSEIGQVEARLRGEIQALKAELTRRIDLLEERMKRQQWANGVVIALLIGLYVQLYFR